MHFWVGLLLRNMQVSQVCFGQGFLPPAGGGGGGVYERFLLLCLTAFKLRYRYAAGNMYVIVYLVEEQIDETDIRKIPQIVWAESGSLTVPV